MTACTTIAATPAARHDIDQIRTLVGGRMVFSDPDVPSQRGIHLLFSMITAGHHDVRDLKLRHERNGFSTEAVRCAC
jgi:hypothetical protein